MLSAVASVGFRRNAVNEPLMPDIAYAFSYVKPRIGSETRGQAGEVDSVFGTGNEAADDLGQLNRLYS